MLEQLEQLIGRIDERTYRLEDIRNRQIVNALLPAAGGLRNLALSYEDDSTTNSSLNHLAARLAEVHKRLHGRLVEGVSIVALKEENGKLSELKVGVSPTFKPKDEMELQHDSKIKRVKKTDLQENQVSIPAIPPSTRPKKEGERQKPRTPTQTTKNV